MGASAVQLEDQRMPKRCGHLDGKSLVSTDEMVGKICAAVDARNSESTLIIARTDARAVYGLEAALTRAERYLEAGADVLFIEAPQSLEEIGRIQRQFADRVPLLANMVEGGKTPLLDAKSLDDSGFSIVIFPAGIVRAMALTAHNYYQNLVETGSNRAFAKCMYDFNGLNRVLGTQSMLDTGRQYGESES
jgi:2-methylisocitrate lyase-like PEP mutase family enzyme